MQAWRRWCTQMLCALSYLHAQSPSIIHGNLTCDSVFIAHNGLIKIGAVAPDAIRQTVKSACTNGLNNMHTLAPELLGEANYLTSSNTSNSNYQTTLSPTPTNLSSQTCPATDIYAFGVVALEMALLGFSSINTNRNDLIDKSQTNPSNVLNSSQTISNNNSSISPPPLSMQPNWSRESLLSMLEQIELLSQREFIRSCLALDPNQRPSARSLLFHPLVFQVPSLQLLCAHRLVSSDSTVSTPELLAEELQKRRRSRFEPIAEIPSMNGQSKSITSNDLNRCSSEHIEQLVEEVRDGVHPMYAFEKRKLLRTCSSQLIDVTSNTDSNANRLSDLTLESDSLLFQNESRARFDSMKSEISSSTFYNHTSMNDLDLTAQSRSESQLFGSADSLPVQFDSCSHCAEPTYANETRRIVAIEVLVQYTAALQHSQSQPMLSIRLRLDDQMNRQLSCELSELDSPLAMAEELIYYGFINPVNITLLTIYLFFYF